MNPSTEHNLWRVVRLALGFAATYALAWWLWDVLQVDRDVDDGSADDVLVPVAEVVWLLVMLAGIALTISVDGVAERSRKRSSGRR